MSDWTTFGRVDADGTVFVKTTDGERVVGSWQAGTPEEGLAHFARRFADLVTEVDLIETRLHSGAADAAHSLTSIRRLRGGLPEAHAVGDIDGLCASSGKLGESGGVLMRDRLIWPYVENNGGSITQLIRAATLVSLPC